MPDSMTAQLQWKHNKKRKGRYSSIGNRKHEGNRDQRNPRSRRRRCLKEFEVLRISKAGACRKNQRALEQKLCSVTLAKVENLFIEITAVKGDKSAVVTIADSHTNIIRIQRDGETIFEKDQRAVSAQKKLDRSNLSVSNIYEFANTVDIEAVKPVLGRQIKYNMESHREGMYNKYGAAVGQTLTKHFSEDITTKVKAYTAAGSDVRMSGCVLPVVINSGSGNQGMTVSIPVIVEQEIHRSLTGKALQSPYPK